tara:strand:+ start:2553 stop:2711 length:159 start_codon:yes stop_codon:yes gene_type:complete
MKSKEYKKISNDIRKPFEEVRKKRKLFYVNDERRTEIESLLIYLNKDKIAQA